MKRNKIMKLVWDIEGNGLLDTLTDTWCLVTKDIDTNSILKFSDYDKALPDMDYGIEHLNNATLHIGHNLLGYDLPAMKMIHGWELSEDIKVIDTWILSLLNRYKRSHNHGLKGWGQFLGSAKIEFDDWTKYSKEQLNYCVQDVNLNHKVYNYLAKESQFLIGKNPMFSDRIKIEMYIARLNASLNEKGWVYDEDLSTSLLKELNGKMKKIEKLIEPKLGTRRVYKDKVPKTPKYTKAGWYNANTARMLTEHLGRKIIPEDALLDEPPIAVGERFARYSDEPITMSNPIHVKEYLIDELGWKPEEYNRKKNPSGYWVNASPKLEGNNLLKLGEVGKGVKEYGMLSHRRSLIEGFEGMVEKRGDGRISGNMWTIGTPSFRVRHERIVNLPKNKKNVPYGKECRSLFITEKGRQVVGCDSAGNQLRGFCHVVNNGTYTAKVLGHDAHQYHADLIGSTRDEAKVFIFRILFGSTAWGLGKAFGKSEAYAQDLIDNFKKEVPEFQSYVDKLEAEWDKNQGWIFGLTGTILFVDEKKKVLNYVLQDLEKATCAAATYYTHMKMREEGIDFYPLIFYHDENAWSVADKDVERAKELANEGFREGPKMFGVMIMDGGDGVAGLSYADVH
jgi:hypothetical protein